MTGVPTEVTDSMKGHTRGANTGRNRQLLVAYRDDPAGYGMAKHLAEEMDSYDDQDGEQDDFFCGKYYDLVIIPTPAISADWLEQRYDYDGFVFLSKHAAESGTLALTCHSTGNFSEAKFGGNPSQVAIPHPHLQKSYLRMLAEHKDQFLEFEITIEATHHGPTALNKPSIFIEIGTTPAQWEDTSLCDSVADLVHNTMSRTISGDDPVAICFGGNHYPSKFTNELLEGKHALGTVIPRHALDHLDAALFSHILARNGAAKAALLDGKGLGSNKQKVYDLLGTADLEVITL